MTLVSKKIFKLIFAVLCMAFVFVTPVSAYGYEIIIADGAELLTPTEESKLYSTMEELVEYGNVLFYSTFDSSLNAYNVNTIAFGKESSTVFFINMNTRILSVWVGGEMADHVSKGRCDTIADNVYRLASDGDYYGCANKAFTQVLATMRGEKIAAPMQMASNICLAITISLIINYILVRILHGNRKPKTVTMMKETGNYVYFRNVDKWVSNTSRRYSPRSKSHGGGGGGGGGFGGGGHGGSHSF